jgi:hypothetical protein
MIRGKELIELSYDVQSGLGNTDVPDFDTLRTMGVAATLAIHLRGLPEIEYELLRKISSYFFGIASSEVRGALDILADIEYVKLVTKSHKILSVIPQVPRFQDLYEGVGERFVFSDLNEHEQGTLLILSELKKKPENRDRLMHSTGIDNSMLDRCMEIGKTGHYLKQFRARGRDIIASPFYFADNLDGLVEIASKAGASDIAFVIDVIKRNQGWPLSMIEQNLAMGGQKLTITQKSLLLKLCSEGILKPPSIKFSNKSESFIFTPRPGGTRLDSSNREIYERAMGLVSCVRKGQLLADSFKIRNPLAILGALRDKGYLGASSEAANQYRNLVVLRVGHLKATPNGRHQFHLIRTEENKAALNLAIDLLRTGEVTSLDVNQEARIALSKDETYVQSLIGAAELKKRQTVATDAEATEQFEQLLMEY